MSNTFGNRLKITLFGESHGPAIGAVIDGLPSGVRIDEEKITSVMAKRKAAGSISTGRQEKDQIIILSGVKDGYAQGTPLAFMIRNENVRRSDYDALANTARPSHADYAAHVHYRGYEDASGGGHFSGRLTAPLSAAGAICMSMLEEKGIVIGTHIARLADISDTAFDPLNPKDQIETLNQNSFPVLDEAAGKWMKEEIEKAREENDSLGGILETAVSGLEAGVGEPWFDSVESMIAHAMFSIPACKGISFGSGFALAGMKGSEANDPFAVIDGSAVTETNHNGGINGGISNGMPILFQTVIKPTPSIARKQKTIRYDNMEETEIEIHGRHDPAIAHRAAIVQSAMCAIVLVDLLMEYHGSAWFAGERK